MNSTFVRQKITLAVRFRQHRGYVRNKEIEKETGEHFNKAGNQMLDINLPSLKSSIDSPSA